MAGRKEQFCCYGCQSVCDVIVQSGNADFYQHRDAASPQLDVENLPALLDKLKIYDREEIQAGFVRTDANSKQAWLALEEIRCAACLWLNERTLRQLAGVLEVNMDYTSQQAMVRWDPEQVSLSVILAAISRIGYVAHPFDPSHREALNAELKQRSIKRLIVAALLGMMVMQIAIGSYFYGAADAQGEYPLWVTLSRWSSLLLSGVILVYPGQLFFLHAWRDLKNRTLGMDVPVALGLSVAWLTSLVSTVTGQGEVYYESIAMFVTFLLLARYAEVQARATATSLLDRSEKIIPHTVMRESVQGVEEVAVFDLAPGDVIVIEPGEAVPVDGRLLSPQSSFDESMLNGESQPVRYLRGERVVGGSINIDQPVTLEVLTTSDRSTLGKIQQLTRSSVSRRSYYIDIADSVAGKFVAGILLIAAITAISWYFVDSDVAVEHAITVLIVTCPCALALAAPVSLSLCAAGLSRMHIIAVRLSVIEQLNTIDCIVFDKTGTLTTGMPELEEVIAADGSVLSAGTLLQLAAQMETGSEHPFAKAIRRQAGKALHHDSLQNVFSIVENTNFSGEGVEAVVSINGAQTHWRLGSEAFAAGDFAVDRDPVSKVLQQKIHGWRQRNGSVLFLRNDTGLQAVFFVHDPLRPGIAEFLTELDSRVQRVILSGDHVDSVKAVANVLGIEEAHGNMLPQDKLYWLQQRQRQGAKLFMLGDGINDAPTLATADVSATFAGATDLAKTHSDLLILRKGYLQLAEAMAYMRKTRAVIVQNLGWAIAYNLIAIPAAALGWVTPWMAAFGMSASSLLVVANSLRLKHL